MNPTETGAYAIGAVTGLFLLILTARWAWHHACAWAAQRIETHMAQAIGRPTHYRDLDTEYRQLVAAQHNQGNDA